MTTSEWSHDNRRIGHLACHLGLLDPAEWERVLADGPPADATERAATDAAVGGTLLRLLLERSLIDFDAADRLREAAESGQIDQLLGDKQEPAAEKRTAAAGDEDDDGDFDDGDFDGEENDDDEYEYEDDDDDEADETDDDVAPPKTTGTGTSRGWLDGLADAGAKDRRQTARIATVAGKVQIRPTSGASDDPGGSADDVVTAAPIAPTGPTGKATSTGAARDPFTGASQIGPYILLEILRHREDSAMFKARHAATGELAALKLLVRPADDPRVQRFLADAASAAALHHPLITEMQEHGSDNGRHFAAVDFVADARTLDQLPHSDARAAADLVRRLALAVHDAHGAGRVHGRLRPGCILIDPFGEPHITGFVFPGGTPGDAAPDPPFHAYMLYASPELVRTDRTRVDARSDVFSLGAILYRLLTDDVPWDADSPAAYRRRVTSEDPMPPRQLAPDVPRGIELVCLKALSRDPAQRYPTASDMAEDLQRWLDGREVGARPAGVTQRMQAIVVNQPKVAMAMGGMAIGAIVVVVLIIAAVVFALSHHANNPAGDNGARLTNNSSTSPDNHLPAGGNNTAATPAQLAAAKLRREQATAALGKLPDLIDDPAATRAGLLDCIQPLRDVIAVDTTWSAPHYWLGRAQQRSGAFDEAIASFATAATLDPPMPAADLQLVMLLAFARDAAADDPLPAAAAAPLQRLLAIGPSAPAEARAMRMIADGLPGLIAGTDPPRDPDDENESSGPSQQVLRRAVDLAPTLSAAQTVLGYSLGALFPRGHTIVDRRDQRGASRPADALAMLDESLRQDPTDPGANAIAGLHRETFGQAGDARAALQRALVLRPQWAIIEYALARALALDGDLIAATRQMNELTARIANNADYWRYYGTLLILAGDWAGAEQRLTRALALRPDEHVLFLRAMVRTQVPYKLERDQVHPASSDLDGVIRDPGTTWNRDRYLMWGMAEDARPRLRAAIASAHDYFAMPPEIKVLIRQLRDPDATGGALMWRDVWSTAKARPWSPALGDLLYVLDGDAARHDALIAGLERFRPESETLGLDDWLTPARLQRMLHNEQLLEQRRTAGLKAEELYVRACIRFRTRHNLKGAYNDLSAAIDRIRPGSTSDRLAARLYFARSAVKLNVGDQALVRDEMTRWAEALPTRLADLQWAIKLDRLLTSNWRSDPDYERLWRD